VSGQPASSERVRVRRHADRASYDPAVVASVLDAGRVCHLGFVVAGRPAVIPTIYGRDGDLVYVHGSVASRVMQGPDAVDVCLTVTHLDGLVLARSAFHHSLNYRSAVVVGDARPVTDDDEKLHALAVITDHVAPGRWAASRPPNRKELGATSVLALPTTQASVKIRTGPPIDDGADVGGPWWAGVVPVTEMLGEPEPAADLRPDVAVPDHVVALARQAIGT
jgi:nitroimidazol reductase NimA-like FMN-containing flavoprotein (pyridoxamine 5'-phosphate oxidase superfamily)